MEDQNHLKEPHHPSEASRRIVRSLKAKADARRTRSEKFADWLTSRLGSVKFLLANVTWFGVWIVLNTGLIPGITPFDPYPFGFLTMIVSLEAIMLAIVVLVSQNRAMKVDDLREEIDLQVDIITEQEITKLMSLVILLLQKNGVDISKDMELQEMLQPTDTGKIQKILEKQAFSEH
ncbi:MAG: hypothetical protein G01um101420_475 [Parcubacteria group bacterium Gr01-1014_20]|nr:MAG: hypothetical protein G01um101420_475 [Parcubacteria group bacterium Gr01-1014_20]